MNNEVIEFYDLLVDKRDLLIHKKDLLSAKIEQIDEIMKLMETEYGFNPIYNCDDSTNTSGNN